MNVEITKIYESYFKKNKNLIKEEEIDISNIENDVGDLGQMVADAVNKALSELSEDNPSRNRGTGIKMMDRIKQEIQNKEKDPEIIGEESNNVRNISKIIEDVLDEMISEIT